MTAQTIRVNVDVSGMRGYGALLRKPDQMIADIVQGTVNTHRATYLEPIYNADPGPSQHRGQWSTNPAANARARRGYWARVRSGQISVDPVTGAYIRTGQLAKLWYLTVTKNRVTLRNDDPAIKYVSTFGPIVARGGQPNPGHILTGWAEHNTTLALIMINRMANDVQKGISASIRASVKAGRYTVAIP